MKKTYKKVFNYEGQFVNYWNKVVNNPQIVNLFGMWSVQDKAWIITYQYR